MQKLVIWSSHYGGFYIGTSCFCDENISALEHPQFWILGVEVWSVGQKSRFFDLRWGSLGCCVVPNIFGAASYRITWPGRKNLGDGGTFPASVGAQKHLKRKIGGFRNDPQMSFWETGCRECVGARQKYDQKKLQTMEMFFDTLIASWR